MPAAELSRLRIQINRLIEHFDDPTGMRNALRDLLDQYANRAYRAGQAVQTQSILPSYRVPPLVMRQLELELGKTCQEQPDAGLEVVETLWRDSYLEPRLLAVSLLGAMPASHAEAVAQKLRLWATPKESSRMLDALFRGGTSGLRRETPQILLQLIEDWTSSLKPEIQALGLRALAPLIQDPGYENLPPVYRMLSPMVQFALPALQTDLQIVIEILAKRSPTETVYFLRQVLNLASGPGTARIIRRCLPAFEPEQQASLRKALQTANPE